jgi:hypothetical protein
VAARGLRHGVAALQLIMEKCGFSGARKALFSMIN